MYHSVRVPLFVSRALTRTEQSIYSAIPLQQALSHPLVFLFRVLHAKEKFRTNGVNSLGCPG